MTDRPVLVPPAGVRGENLQVCYAAALHNLLDVNTIPDGGSAYVRAGGGYSDPWTRDAAINAWHAASLLSPEVAGYTLLKVCTDGLIAQDIQWWDQIIWVIGARHHRLVTGDTAFGAEAFRIASASLEILRRDRFDASTGLYRGPSLMQDGIAGFPEPPYQPGNPSSFVLDHPGAAELRCLSTNAVYVGALGALEQLAADAGADPAPYPAQRAELVAAVNEHLWSDESEQYGYFLGPDGLDPHQETAGLALAVEFGIAGPERAAGLVAGIHHEPFGVVNVWPHFPRFDADHPGRHNAICWPMVMGLWGYAAARAGQAAEFGRTVDDLVRLFRSSGDELFELYNATTGEVDGGWQVGRQWESLPHQTWSATALLRLVHEGLFGLKFGADGITLRPTVPPSYAGEWSLRSLRYRAATLDITVRGEGTEVRSVHLDGQPQDAPHVPAALSGHHQVDVVVS
ncbi:MULTISPECIES: MGH1-like glycoside hydrolase domain-containing protein [Kribbella]|uniref:Mannosylglycerate hydrolase MGH1-like glycoside hydrolase domain-containing protein n=1 Tax=Kribbella karoonensis TaxID=324851 RepID=A0ABN2D1U7_9ACTN